MARVLAVVSPSKKMNHVSTPQGLEVSPTEFRKQSEFILSKIKVWDSREIAHRMTVSQKIALSTESMHKAIIFTPEPPSASPAILTYSGDVYRGIDARNLSLQQLHNAQKSLRIISALYGYLKPLHLIQHYRLMMATPMSEVVGISSLVSFWKPFITDAINSELSNKDYLINLTSQEYSAVIDHNEIQAKIIKCDFKEMKNGKIISVSTFAKLARGQMARFIITENINSISALRTFNQSGYTFNSSLSDEATFIFTR